MNHSSWIPFSVLVVCFWGIWAAYSAYPATQYGMPDEMIYIVWSVSMIIPTIMALRKDKFDFSLKALKYGLISGLTATGGQLLLFKALTMGPAYIVFPITSLQPAITVLLAVIFLKEKLSKLAVVGLILALLSVLFTSISETGEMIFGTYLILAVIIAIGWGVQAYYLRKASLEGINETTQVCYLTISGFILVPVAFYMMESVPDLPAQSYGIAFGTQLLNAIGALFYILSLKRGKASIVSPVCNSLAPVATIAICVFIFSQMPNSIQFVGIVFAIIGSAILAYTESKSEESNS